jgi:predicted aspartyl protease
LTRIIIPFNDMPVLFVQVTGKNGKKRDLLAAIDPASQDVVIPRIDAFYFGYDAYADQPGLKEELPLIPAVGISSIATILEFPLVEVRVGPIAVKNVVAAAHDTPYQSGIDVVLGTSFLNKLKTTIDYEKKQIVLEDFPQQPEEKSQ